MTLEQPVRAQMAKSEPPLRSRLPCCPTKREQSGATSWGRAARGCPSIAAHAAEDPMITRVVVALLVVAISYVLLQR